MTGLAQPLIVTAIGACRQPQDGEQNSGESERRPLRLVLGHFVDCYLLLLHYVIVVCRVLNWGAGTPIPLGDVQPTANRDAVAALTDRRALAVRYGAVSMVNVINHQILLNLANSGWGWSGGWSNVFAALLAAIPGYLLSRRWVWKVNGAHSFREEIAPFWALALIGLVLSTVLAETADRVLGAGVWVAVGSLAGYFVVWVLKFVILDRMFDRAAKRLEQV